MSQNTKYETFLVKTTIRNYSCLLVTTFDPISKLDLSYDVLMGGKLKGCVQIMVKSKHHNDFDRSDKSIAQLLSVKYDKNCDNKGTLETGTGTQHMIRTAFNIVLRWFPWIRSFSFTDASSKHCRPNGQEVSLAQYYMALHGQTWYERNFKARIYNDFLWEKYKKQREILQDPEIKPIKYNKMRGLFNLPKDKEKSKLFESSRTLGDYFRVLNDTMDKESLCDYLEPWIERFVDMIMDEHINRFWKVLWIIYVDDIQPVSFKDPWTSSISSDLYDSISFGKRLNGQEGGFYFLDSSRKLQRLL